MSLPTKVLNLSLRCIPPSRPKREEAPRHGRDDGLGTGKGMGERHDIGDHRSCQIQQKISASLKIIFRV